MKTIWKFPVMGGDPEITVEMPRGAKLLALQQQRDEVCLWAEVDPEQPREPRRFSWYGTGLKMPAGDRAYVGTVQQAGGYLVLHLYEEAQAASL